MTVVDRVATINVKNTLSNEQAEAALRKVLREGAPEIGGLQEWGRNRQSVVKRLKASTRIRFTRAKNGPPVFFTASRYGIIKVEDRLLARREWVGVLARRRSTLPANYATLAILADDEGPDVALINCHLTPEVQRGPGYRRDAAHRRRVARHKREVRRVGRVARRQAKKGRRVYIVGDFNFAGLDLLGFISCWKGRGGGTLGSRAVDVVYAQQAARQVLTISTPSDHRAVVAVYMRTSPA